MALDCTLYFWAKDIVTFYLFILQDLKVAKVTNQISGIQYPES